MRAPICLLVATAFFGACGYPDTKMEVVESVASSPARPDQAKAKTPPSEQPPASTTTEGE
jgi:hypothetical protein